METIIYGYIGIMENKMETTIYRVYRDDGKLNGN